METGGRVLGRGVRSFGAPPWATLVLESAINTALQKGFLFG